MEFSFLLKTNQEKAADALLTEENSNYVSGENFESSNNLTKRPYFIIEILRVYQNIDTTTNPSKLTKYIMKRTDRAKSHTQSLKSLVLLHKLIHTLGPASFNLFSQGKERYSVLSHLAFAEHYQIYLAKLIHNYEDLKVAFGDTNGTEPILTQQNVSIFHLLSKIQNFLHLLLNFDPIFNVCLIQYAGESILKQAAYLILCDCSAFYSFLNTQVHEIIGQVFSLPTNEAIFLYEIFCENLKLGRKLKNIMQFKVLLKDFQILEPTDLTVPPEEIQQMKVFMNSLKARVHIGMLKLDVKYNLNTQEEQDLHSPEKSLNTSALFTNLGEHENTPKMTAIEVEKDAIKDSPKRISFGTPSFKADARFSFNPGNRFSFNQGAVPLRLTKGPNQADENRVAEEPEHAISPDSFRYRPNFPAPRISNNIKENHQEEKSSEIATDNSTQAMIVIPHKRFTLGKAPPEIKTCLYEIIETDKSPRNTQEESFTGFIEIKTPKTDDTNTDKTN